MAIDKALYNKPRKNFRVAGAVGREYDRPSAPATSAPRSSPFSGGESRQQYSATQTQTGAVKGGGAPIRDSGGNVTGFETGFVSGDRGRDSQQEFINTLNRNNRIAAEKEGRRFVPYQGGARMSSTYRGGGLGDLFKVLLGLAIPGFSFLTGGAGKLKEGIDALNQRIQGTDFARSKNLMDYLDIKKFGGFDERELAREKVMRESSVLSDLLSERKLEPRDYGMAGLTMPSVPQNKSGIIDNIDLGNPTGDDRIVPEEQGLEGDGSFKISSLPNNFNFNSDVAPEFRNMIMQTGINETQKKMIDNAANMYGRVNPGEKLDATTQKEIFDSVKPFDTKAKDKTLGLFGGQEADPMTEQEYKDYLISQGFI